MVNWDLCEYLKRITERLNEISRLTTAANANAAAAAAVS